MLWHFSPGIQFVRTADPASTKASMNRPASDVLDPVAAYDRVAPFFSDISGRRKRYLDSINELTVARIPSGSHSLLDVGAGDGKRARRIARQAGLQDIVLLEPSAEMMKDSPNSDGIWKIRVEDVGRKDGGPASRRFDVVTCLWNVLGHGTATPPGAIPLTGSTSSRAS